MSQIQPVASMPESLGDSSSLAERYERVRRTTLDLAAPLDVEDTVVQSMPEASPTKWHLAHTTWFFETFLLGRLDGYQPHHPEFNYLFNSYYNAIGPRHCRPKRGLLSRPTLDQVIAYRRAVDDRLLGALAKGSFDSKNDRAALVLGLHHEQQHQELIVTDIKHLFGTNPLQPAYPPAAPRGNGTNPRGARGRSATGAVQTGWTRFSEAIVSIGHDGSAFAFDNERPRHRRLVPAFEIANRPVTNGEYLEFIREGGYRRPELWLSDGWNTVQQEGWTGPLYWYEDDERLYTLAGVRPIDPDEPVCHVSYYEADAFARWAGARLPDEAEWEKAADGAGAAGPFLEDSRFHPLPAGGEEASSPVAMLGNTWEWTRSPYTAYPGYVQPPGAFGEYNAKFMCNQLVLRGGSCATPRSHIRVTYRNFFQPEARWQFMGLRLARDAK
jgi:ergothioneine biosynthesis protein EgtB